MYSASNAWLSLTLFGCLLAACAAPPRLGTGDGATEDAALTTDATDSATSERDASPPADVASPPMACSKIDILFVIDNSASMADQQRSLVASFPGFVAAMRNQLAFADSVQIGVVTSDAYRGNAPGCRAIGDLVTQTAGVESSNGMCGPWSGDRFMHLRDADIQRAFACAGQVGVTGDDDEKMARALLGALDPARSASGACNQGFSRRDSLLVVVMITDEDDAEDGCMDGPPRTCLSYGSGGTPQEWYDQLVRHRFGVAGNIVMLSLVGRRVDNPCGAQVNSRILGLTRRFGANGLVDDVCASNYDGFFTNALGVIQNACRGYIPPPG